MMKRRFDRDKFYKKGGVDFKNINDGVDDIDETSMETVDVDDDVPQSDIRKEQADNKLPEPIFHHPIESDKEAINPRQLDYLEEDLLDAGYLEYLKDLRQTAPESDDDTGEKMHVDMAEGEEIQETDDDPDDEDKPRPPVKNILLKYNKGKANIDIMLGGGAVGICIAGLIFLNPGALGGMSLFVFIALFLWYIWRALLRLIQKVEVSPSGIELYSLINVFIEWRKMTKVKLRYFAARRKHGVFTLVVRGENGEKIELDSSLQNFDFLLASFAQTIRINQLVIDATTRANFALMGHHFSHLSLYGALEDENEEGNRGESEDKNDENINDSDNKSTPPPLKGK